MSEPLELVLKTTPSKVVAYACPDCHCVVQQAQDDPGLDASVRKAAAEHCVHRCSSCDAVLVRREQVKDGGAPCNYPGYGMCCTDCDQKHEQEKDQKRFNAAQHLTEEEWGNDPKTSTVVYLEGVDRYFPEGLDELREWWADHHYDKDHPDVLPDFPEYAWVCDETVGVSLDAQQILECALEEYHEDAIDQVDVDGLQVVLDAWSKQADNQVHSWSPNFKQLVQLSEEANKKFLAEWRKEA